MKSIWHALVGLFLLGLTMHAARTGEIPGRNGGPGLLASSEPGLFWFGIVSFACMGLGLIWHAFRGGK